MRKFLTAAVAALTFGGAVLSASTPAQAQHGGFRGGGGFHGGGFRGGGFRGGFRGGRGWGGDGALFAGVTGLALGAALASPYYYGPGYGYGYGYDPYYYGPPPPYYYGRGYGFCYSRARVWDPEIGRYVFERARVPC